MIKYETNQALKRALLPSPGPRTIPFGIGRGVNIHIDFPTQLQVYLGVYEIEISRHLRRLLRPGLPAFDVGAQYGYDALVIAKRTGAPVASFDAWDECVTGMAKSFALNPDLGQLITPVHAMIGPEDGQLGLDEYAYGPGFVPGFIKLDIEGGELGALRSAQRILAERHPAVIVEVHSADLERACGILLVNHGYRPIIVNQRRVWPEHRPTELNRWLVAA